MSNIHKKEFLYIGWIVRCVDIDSSDEYCIEVFIRNDIDGDKLQQAAVIAAKENELVSMSSNHFEFEVEMKSGRFLKKTIIREQTGDYTPEAQEALNNHKFG